MFFQAAATADGRVSLPSMWGRSGPPRRIAEEYDPQPSAVAAAWKNIQGAQLGATPNSVGVAQVRQPAPVECELVTISRIDERITTACRLFQLPARFDSNGTGRIAD